MKSKCIVKRVPEIKGCYGERWFIIKNGTDEVHQFFNLISLWHTGVYSSKDEGFIKGYELPMGFTLNIEDPFISYIFNKLNIEVDGD